MLSAFTPSLSLNLLGPLICGPTAFSTFLMFIFYLREPFFSFPISLTSFSLTSVIHPCVLSKISAWWHIPIVTLWQVPCSCLWTHPLEFLHFGMGFFQLWGGFVPQKNSKKGEKINSFSFWPGNCKVSKYISVCMLGKKPALNGKFGNRKRNDREWGVVMKGFNFSMHSSELEDKWDKILSWQPIVQLSFPAETGLVQSDGLADKQVCVTSLDRTSFAAEFLQSFFNRQNVKKN